MEEKDPDNLLNETPAPQPEDPPTQPSQRLRRLLAASEENQPDAPDESLYAGNAASSPGESQDAQNQPPRQGSEAAFSEADRHPTGHPDATGGWYGSSETPQPPPSPSIARTTATPARPSSPSQATRASAARLRAEQPTTPPASGTTGRTHLPQRVDEVDSNATQVTPAAYTPPAGRRAERTTSSRAQDGATYRPAAGRVPAYAPRRAKEPKATASLGWQNALGCLFKMLVGFLFVAILALLGVLSFGVYKYFSIAATLPPVGDLRNRASQFETTRILDREGNLLYEILDPQAGRRTYVPLERISPYVIAATLATEDKEFYNHPGFDPFAILRALIQNYTTGEIVSGASTITQQLARTLLLTPSERSQRTADRKAREIVLAAEITRRYSKDEILELYLNENYYGNLAYGIEAAAETYFGATADKLTLSQSAFLAGLPQAPSVYDIFTNREETLRRFKQVLVLMYQLSQDKNCIEVNNSVQPVCVSAEAAAQALSEIEGYSFRLRQITMRYPHWVTYVRMLLEDQFDAQTIYRSGFTVYTTIDPELQERAMEIVKRQVDTLADRNVTNGALVVIRPSTGEILAMVGSADFDNEAISGQVNMSISPRQPGSSIKPLTYTAAFEKGWTPATLIWDVESEFPPSGDPNDPRPPYVPVNYDERFHGPVTVRSALANSYNVPAVKTLQFVGIYDDPNTPEEEGFISLARRMGITTLTRADYGLSLTLGGGDVTLLDLTAAYAIFANGGRRLPPLAITRIEDFQGDLVFEHELPPGEQVIRPEHAFLISSILSDNAARTPMFGSNSVLNLPFAVAAKTGTTNDFRDNWTLGYTPDLAVGVWVGNANYTPMVNTSGLTGAAPIWSEYMQFALEKLTGGNPTPFFRPAGIIERVICSVSGAEPSEWCPSQRPEFFAFDQPPLSKENDLWKKAHVDTWSGLRASPYCSDFTEEVFSLNVSDRWAIRWIKETGQGREWVESIGFKDEIFFTPEKECKEGDPRPKIVFSNLSDGQTITGSPLDIYAVVYADDDFRDFRLQYGVGDDPVEWKNLVKDITEQYRQPERIYTWDLKDVPSGRITLRIYLRSTEDTYADRRIQLRIDVPTPTPTRTPTPTVTSTITPTPTETLTPMPDPTETEATIQINTVGPPP